MICPNCLKNVATVHVTEILPAEPATAEPGPGTYAVQEQHLCEVCAQGMDLPHATAVKKKVADIWKLLQLSAQQPRKRAGQTCPQCGMSLDEFRKKGRLGCPQDYEVFKAHIGELLERVHGSRTHVGRVPGASEADLELQAHPRPALEARGGDPRRGVRERGGAARRAEGSRAARRVLTPARRGTPCGAREREARSRFHVEVGPRRDRA